MKLEVLFRVAGEIVTTVFEGPNYRAAYDAIVTPEGGQIMSVRTID